MFKRYIPRDLYFLIWWISLAFYVYASVFYLTEIKDMGLIMKASLLLILTTGILYTRKGIYTGAFYRRIYAPLYIYILLWLFGFFLFGDGAFATKISHVCFYLLPLIIYPIANLKILEDEQFCFSMFLIMILASFAYYLVFKDLNVFQIGDDTLTAHLSASYLPVILLPCVLLSRNKLLHIIAWLLSAVVIFSSLKRGGIVALVLAFAAYMFFFVRDLKGRFIKILIFAAGVFLVYELVVLFMAFDESIGGITAHRFEGFLSGGYQDESRFNIAREVINAISNSDPLSILFGHGYLSVRENIASSYSAHNDFLEVLFDFGIVGFIFYLCMHIHFIKKALFLFKVRSEYAPSFAVFYSLYLVWSVVSIIILYPIMVFLTVYLARVNYLIKRDKVLGRIS